MLSFETLRSTGDYGTVKRAPVPGGWLVLYESSVPNAQRGSSTTTSITFYPDPGHQWTGSSSL